METSDQKHNPSKLNRINKIKIAHPSTDTDHTYTYQIICAHTYRINKYAHLMTIDNLKTVLHKCMIMSI